MWIKLLPYIIGVGLITGAWFHGLQTGTQKAYQKAIKEIAKMDKKCPDCNCPKQEPCNGFTLDDKIKGKYITIENHQHITANMDSLLVKKITQDVDEIVTKRLTELKVVRAKK